MMTTHATTAVVSSSLAMVQAVPTRAGRPESRGIVTEHRSVAPFTRIHQRTSFPVFVAQKANASVDVRVDADLRSFVDTVVEDGVLRVVQTAAFDSSRMPFVAVAVPRLEGAVNSGAGAMVITRIAQHDPLGLACRGSGDVTFQGAAGALSAQASGSGALTLIGSAAYLMVRATASGAVDASHFVAGGADVSASGSGAIAVRVVGRATIAAEGAASIDATLDRGLVDFSIAGSGGIAWSGDAEVASVRRTGSGRLTRLGR
jgi:hypothetical protein